MSVQVIPPPEPPDEPAPSDECHDDNINDDFDPCGDTFTPPEQIDVEPADEALPASETPAPEPTAVEPTNRGFSGWWIAIALALGALVLGWMRKIRHR